MYYRKFYRCSVCGNEWEDVWDCLCNDRCPDCDTETEVSEYQEVSKEEMKIIGGLR